MIQEPAPHKIILFDGVCNLCSGTVSFVIKRDSKDIFRFASLQSETGENLTAKYGIDTAKVDSIILIDEGAVYIKFTAALRIARSLPGAYPLLYCFIIIPRFFRDWIYEGIARKRYAWFGKKESCMVPTPELKSKFL
jgi:predicted DCC family thiol-disulfide oxidoreductase YuxK